MDGWALGFFLLAAFLGGLASGIAGFAMGFVVSGIWLHILTPIQTTTLIVGYGLWTQGYGVWKLRHTLNWRQVAPFIIGGAIGVPIGTMLLTSINPAYLRTLVGVLLVLYSIYGLAQPAFKPIKAGVPADAGIGVLNGLFAGVTGLPGLIVTIWSQLRGWPKDVQRTVFQPVMRGHRDERSYLESRWRRHHRNGQAVCAWPPCAAGRPVERIQTLWKTRRCSIPQGDPGAVAGVRAGADRARVDLPIGCLIFLPLLSSRRSVGIW
jgi:hypothetical protein